MAQVESYKRFVVRRLALLLAAIVLVGSLLRASRNWAVNSIPFSKAGWKSTADWGDRWPMAKRFIETGCLVGMTESQIIEMLGDERRKDDGHNVDASGESTLTYFICGRLRYGMLIINFKEGRVVSARIMEV
jgi:hypothetical protein